MYRYRYVMCSYVETYHAQFCRVTLVLLVPQDARDLQDNLEMMVCLETADQMELTYVYNSSTITHHFMLTLMMQGRDGNPGARGSNGPSGAAGKRGERGPPGRPGEQVYYSTESYRSANCISMS